MKNVMLIFSVSDFVVILTIFFSTELLYFFFSAEKLIGFEEKGPAPQQTNSFIQLRGVSKEIILTLLSNFHNGVV